MSLADAHGSRYRPDIDGLRAIAVLAVVIYHADLGLNGGYVGVDVFFVISGYLITGLIFKELEAGQFKLLAFWERRVRRILPALIAMLFASVLVGWFRLLPQDFKALGQSITAQVALVANCYFYTVAGYFEQEAALKPLLHTWSLAVEEQFYLLFPLLLVFTRRCSRPVVSGIILVLGLMSFVLCVRWSQSHVWANFYFLPTRAWELLLGAWLAVLPSSKPVARWRAEVCGGVGLSLILAGIALFDRDTKMPGLPALLPCGGTAMVIAANGLCSTVTRRLLAFRPLVWLGLISYSIYLWHWPVLVYAKYWAFTPLPLLQRGLLVLLSIALAGLSWRFIEQPFRRRKMGAKRAHLFVMAGSAAAVLLSCGWAINAWQGLPNRLAPAACQYAAGVDDLAFAQGVGLKAAMEGRFAELGAAGAGHPIQVLVWGDSYAMAVMPGIDKLCRKHAVRGAGVAYPATAPLVGLQATSADSLKADSIRYNDAVVQFIRREHVRHVLLVANWNAYTRDGNADFLRRGLQATLAALKDSGAQLWVLQSVPDYPWSVPKRLAAAVIHGEDVDSLGRPELDYRQANLVQSRLFDELAKTARLTVLEPAQVLVMKNGRCRIAAEGWSLYRDHNHLSTRGVRYLSPLFEPLFVETVH